MENLNTDKQPNQIKRNPTRFNTNVKEGKTDEKAFGAETGEGRDVEINPAKFDNDEIDLDRTGDDSSAGNEDADFSGREENNQADGQIEGSSGRVTESEISHKGQAGGKAAHSLGGQGKMGNIQQEALDKNVEQMRKNTPSVDQEGRIKDQNRNGNQQGSQFNQ